MKKLFKKLALMVVALLTFSVGSNYTFKEVRAADTEIVFDFGANGAAGHKDGNDLGSSKSYTSGTYTLSLTNMSKVYGPAYDASGNSCIKLGTSSVVGTFTFTVPDEVDKVYIEAGKYKTNTSKVTVNGTAYTLSNASNNGAYDSLEVDTSSTKKVTFATASGGVRCMVNTIKYVISDNGGSSEPDTSPKLTIPSTADAQVGTTLNLEVTSSNLTEEISWASSDDAIATVINGIVTPVSMGNVTITAEADDVTAECEVKVYPSSANVLTIAEALAICEFTGETVTPYNYKTTGEVVSFEYNETYENYSIVIEDESGEISTYGTSGTGELYIGANITVTGSLQNFKGNTPQFGIGSTYVINESEELIKVKDDLNNIDTYMSLAYSYKATTEMKEVEIPNIETAKITDKLTATTTGMSGTNYGSWSEKTVSSTAVYAGQSAAGNSSIQLRSSNSNSGVITTASGGKVTKITVEWHSATSAGRTLDIYGKDSAYTSPTELYDSNSRGTKLGSIAKGTSTELTINGDYAYIGLRSNSGAMYLTSITIEWETQIEVDSGKTEMKEVTTLSDSQFFIRCGADIALKDIENISNYGLKVTAGAKEAYYNSGSQSWGEELEGETPYCFAIINLQDIINDSDKLQTEFTVEAYAEYNGMKFYSNNKKTYSVVSMVEYYYESEDSTEVVKSKVEHLYNYFLEKGYIAA